MLDGNAPKPWIERLWLPALVSFVLVVFCHIGWLGHAPMSDTEAFRAITAHQMVETGDWLLPRMYGELYVRKPPGHYWLLATVESLVDAANEWIWRLPSVITAGLTAALGALMAGRWFGRIAAWVAGVGYITFIALWAQSRSADIDGNLTFVSIACAFMLLELGFGTPRRKWLWSVGIAITLAASIMLKFHAGLIVVGGVLLGATIATRQWRWLLRPSCWIALLVGVLLPMAWIVAAWLQVQRLGIPPDLSGLREANYNVLNLARVLWALLTPLQLIAMAMPAALLALFYLDRLWRGRDVMARALIGAIAASLLIVLINGVTNPRYGYVTLPLWLPLAGKVGAEWAAGRLPEVRARLLRQIGTGLAVGLAMAHVVLVVLLWDDPARWMPAAATGVLSIATAAVAVRLWMREDTATAAIAIVALFALLTVPVAQYKAGQRWRSSGLEAARIIQTHVPDSQTILSGDMARDKPEILFYSRREVDSRFRDLRDPNGVDLSADTWVVFKRDEWEVWKKAERKQFDAAIDLDGHAWLVHYAPNAADPNQ